MKEEIRSKEVLANLINAKGVTPEDQAAIDAAVKHARMMETLFWLAAYDFVFFGNYNPEIKDWDKDWHCYAYCSDTFFYASADAEGLAEGEEEFLKEVAEKFGWDGVVAWCAVKREMDPLQELLTPKFYEAKQFVLNRK